MGRGLNGGVDMGTGMVSRGRWREKVLGETIQIRGISGIRWKPSTMDTLRNLWG